jgi:DNA-binding Xre family transcriptional regulator
MSLDVLDAICNALKIELEDLLVYSDESAKPEVTLTSDQEDFLCESLDHFTTFLKIVRGYTFDQLCEHKSNEEKVGIMRVIRGLEQAALVEYPSEAELRALYRADVVLKPGRQIRKKYFKYGVEEFFKSSFIGDNEYFRLTTGYLPASKYEEMKKKFADLQNEMNELMSQNRTRKKELSQHKFYWVLAAFRPMERDFLETLAKRIF